MLWQLLAAARPVNVYTSSSTVAVLAIVAAVVVGVVSPIVTGWFLWRNTGRTIEAEQVRPEHPAVDCVQGRNRSDERHFTGNLAVRQLWRKRSGVDGREANLMQSGRGLE